MAGAAEQRPRPLALTMGDPAGLGLELALTAWRDREEAQLPAFVLIADPDAAVARARSTGIDADIEVVSSLSAGAGMFAHRLPVLPLRLAAPANPGFPDPLNAVAVIESIERAVAAVVAGEASAVVTSPIAKSVLYAAGFEHPGHTEFLAHLAEQHGVGTRIHPVMMLVSDVLRVVPLTVHIPLRQVAEAITRERVERTVRIMVQALSSDFGLADPRIAVTGLNPHAGEQGALGREEEDVIGPAVRQLRASGLAVTGPHSADTLFHAGARGGYDAVLAMYHDQALIPLKTLAFDTAVNVTLGLPFVRTSPDHGTGFDIAGQGRASAQSLLAALKLAADIAQRRSVAVAEAP